MELLHTAMAGFFIARGEAFPAWLRGLRIHIVAVTQPAANNSLDRHKAIVVPKRI
jgi:hypothetical protein